MKLISIRNYVIFLCICVNFILFTLIICDASDSIEINASLKLVIVSTLDGQLQAFNTETGEEAWSFSPNHGPLLSSSLSEQKLFGEDSLERLIPALDGDLFKWNGDFLEPLRINADSLLKQSYKLSDSTLLVGGSKASAFGLNAKTGQLIYSCSSENCVSLQPSSAIAQDSGLIVLRRKQQTIRAVCDRTGSERWNFSVGEYELAFHSSVDGDASISTIYTSQAAEEYDPGTNDVHNFAHLGVNDMSLKIEVPEGSLYAINTERVDECLWKVKLSNPISNVWTIADDKINKISLFHQDSIPVLDPDNAGAFASMPPMVYLGVHDGQVYIQQSTTSKELHSKFTSYKTDNNLLSWRPYTASSPSRTPTIEGNVICKDRTACDNALMLLSNFNNAFSIEGQQVAYPYEMGYYLTVDATSPMFLLDAGSKHTLCHTSFEHEQRMYWCGIFLALVSILTSTSWLYVYKMKLWRHEISISWLTMCGYRQTNVPLTTDINLDNIGIEDSSQRQTLSASISVGSDYPFSVFKSRYETEFSQIRRIGSGGFGVVFEAMHNIDGRNYAVKRTCLSNKDEAIVLREVRALAKLDHPGVIRYYNAWREDPTPGWIESHDGQCSDMSASFLASSESKMSPYEFPNSKKVLPLPFSAIPSVSSVTGNDLADYEYPDMDDSGTDVPVNSYSVSTNGHNCNDLQSHNNCLTLNQHLTTSSTSIVFDKNYLGSTDDLVSRSVNEENCTESSVWSSDSLFVKQNTRSRHFGTRMSIYGYLYIQMELCKKESLKDWLFENSVRERAFVLQLFLQIVEAIEYVHNENLMHRDLKPSNIFFSMENNIKIGDFGLATVSDEQQHNETSAYGGGDGRPEMSNQQLTDKVGTHLYMSPEQIKGHFYSNKVDIYAMGLILLELLVTFSTHMERAVTLERAKAGNLPASIPPDLLPLLTCLLDADPYARPSCKQIIERMSVNNIARREGRTISSSSVDSGLTAHTTES